MELSFLVTIALSGVGDLPLLFGKGTKSEANPAPRLPDGCGYDHHAHGSEPRDNQGPTGLQHVGQRGRGCQLRREW